MSLIEIERGKEVQLDVLLRNSATGNYATGVPISDVRVDYWKDGSSEIIQKPLISGDWTELGEGAYSIKFDSDEVDTIGYFVFFVSPVSGVSIEIVPVQQFYMVVRSLDQNGGIHRAVSRALPLLLIDSVNNPVELVPYHQVVFRDSLLNPAATPSLAYRRHNETAFSLKELTDEGFTEIRTTDDKGRGLYTVDFTPDELGLLGVFEWIVQVDPSWGARQWNGLTDIVSFPTHEVKFVVTDQSLSPAIPLPGAEVAVINADTLESVTSVITNQNGEAYAALEDGRAYIATVIYGNRVFNSNNIPFEVDEYVYTTVNINGAGLTVLPTSLNEAILYVTATVVGIDGTPLSGVKFTFSGGDRLDRILDTDVRRMGNHVAHQVTDSSGYMQMPLLKGSEVDISVLGIPLRRRVTIPEDKVYVDLQTSGGSDIVVTADGDFRADWIRSGDVLRISEGPDAGDYTILSVLNPSQMQVDANLSDTAASIRATVVRGSVDVLDVMGSTQDVYDLKIPMVDVAIRRS